MSEKTAIDRQKIHNIKSTLTALIGYTELLEKDLLNIDQSESTKNYIESLKETIESMNKQIMDLDQETSSDIL